MYAEEAKRVQLHVHLNRVTLSLRSFQLAREWCEMPLNVTHGQ